MHKAAGRPPFLVAAGTPDDRNEEERLKAGKEASGRGYMETVSILRDMR